MIGRVEQLQRLFCQATFNENYSITIKQITQPLQFTKNNLERLKSTLCYDFLKVEANKLNLVTKINNNKLINKCHLLL